MFPVFEKFAGRRVEIIKRPPPPGIIGAVFEKALLLYLRSKEGDQRDYAFQH
jgi:hypothetical protein